MSDSEEVKKILRAVLQSTKFGVNVNNLQSEYRSFCGENIPLKKLGFQKLEDYLKSIPSVVRLEHRMGELMCVAGVCKETAHIAELVARQRNAKKAGPSRFVNCKMRFKPPSPYILNVPQRSSLRQPSSSSFGNSSCNGPKRPWTQSSSRGTSASGDYRNTTHLLRPATPVEQMQPPNPQVIKQTAVPNRKEPGLENRNRANPQAGPKPNNSQSNVYNIADVQDKITQLLKKYCNGLWLSKLADVYKAMFNQILHPEALKDLQKWSHICTLEKSASNNRADCLLYPPSPVKPSAKPAPGPPKPTLVTNVAPNVRTPPSSSRPSTPEKLSAALPPPHVATVTSKNVAAKSASAISPPSPVAPSDKFFPFENPRRSPPLAHLHNNPPVFQNGNFVGNGLSGAAANRGALPLAPTWTRPPPPNTLPVSSFSQAQSSNLPPLRPGSPIQSTSTACAPPNSTSVLTAEVRQKIKELLSKYSRGLWAHALPKLFADTYKTTFPEQLMDDWSLLVDICIVEYPIPQNKKKAILYYLEGEEVDVSNGPKTQRDQNRRPPSGVDVVSPALPPRLSPPLEQFPSVLVTEAKSSNTVTIRYVGENYSEAQEAMEEAMISFYSQKSGLGRLSNPVVGQLVAVKVEGEDEVTRAQVMDLCDSKRMKIYYVDYGFSVDMSRDYLFELHQDFLSLPFQATNVRLAGLEAFSCHPLILSSLDNLVVGKIMLMEILESSQKTESPLAVLYDTSHRDDVNINSSCLKVLQDNTMSVPLSANIVYQDACISNVCADGTLYCRLPSRGIARLTTLLEEITSYFISQTTAECLVARPFSGKFCLARHQEKWARAEITNMFGDRVMEILFMDFGVTATLEVTDLREIPPLYLKDLVVIPPQAFKCRLADVAFPEGDLSQEVIIWLKKATLGADSCKMKILTFEDHKDDKVPYIYVYVSCDGQEVHKSVNHQLVQSELLQTPRMGSPVVPADVTLMDRLALTAPLPKTPEDSLQQANHEENGTQAEAQPLKLPPPMELPQPGQTVDVFVAVACHPGYFVVQPWQDLHKLVVLMGEMVLFYNQIERSSTTMKVQKGDVCAARVDKNWHRVQVKGILANGFVSVYELDYGKLELVQKTLLRPLMEEFRQLPFQAVPAQLAGVPLQQWSEEASMLFRNHVEQRALVALVDSVQDVSEVKGDPWERRLTLFLVDTTIDDKDLWIHSIMADIDSDLSAPS